MSSSIVQRLASALILAGIGACAGSERPLTIGVTANRDTIAELDSVTFTAHVGAPSSAARLGWSWVGQPGSPDPWTKPCAGADTVCRIQIHGTGSMYYRVRRASGQIDSARAFVVAAIPPDVGDEPGDADLPPRPAWVGCYRFSHTPFAGELASVRLDTVVVHVTNDIFFWEAPHVPQYHLEPSPAAVGIAATPTQQDPFTSKWRPLPGDSIRLTWGLSGRVLTADLLPHADSLRGVMYVADSNVSQPRQQIEAVGRRTACPP